MTLYTLDSICRSAILKKRYSLHWYVDCLLAAVHCLRELSFDDLRTVNTKLIPVDKVLSVAELPADFVDEVQVGVRIGQLVKPLVPQDSINNLQNFNASMQPIPYNETNPDGSNPFPLYYGGLLGTWWNTSHYNNYGEPTGRFYGFGTGAQYDTYKIIKQRNQIQINETLSVDSIVLQYISSGIDADAATQVDPYAVATIEAYIMWQLKEHRSDIGEGEKERAKAAYINQREILRARKNPLTLDVLKRIISKNTKQSIKS